MLQNTQGPILLQQIEKDQILRELILPPWDLSVGSWVELLRWAYQLTIESIKLYNLN
jgi:hypothetical protein